MFRYKRHVFMLHYHATIAIFAYKNDKRPTMINEQLESLYQSFLPSLSVMYQDLDDKDITDYAGPLLLHCWGDRYLASRHRLMIFGQETDGWYAEYMRTEDDVKAFMKHYEEFRLGENYRSLFWQYAHEINRMINGEDYMNFIWNNVNKFGIDGIGRPHPDVLSEEVQHYNIIPREIEILSPDVCIFLSGPRYDWDLKRKMPDVKFEAFEDYPVNEAARLISSCLPENSFRTYHPGYGNRYSEWYMELLGKFARTIQ